MTIASCSYASALILSGLVIACGSASGGGSGAAGAAADAGGSAGAVGTSGGTNSSAGAEENVGGGASPAGGSNNAGAAGTAGAGGTGGNGVVAPNALWNDPNAFAPVGIVYTHVGQDDSPGLELVGATLFQDGNDVVWAVAERNSGTVPVCFPEVQGVFLDGAGRKLGSTPARLQGPMHKDGQWWAPCLSPGDIGMALTPIATFNVSPTPMASDIQEVQYTSRADVVPSAVKVTTIAVEDFAIVPAPSGGVTITGAFANHGTAGLQRAVIYFFPVNAVGRPLDMAHTLSHSIEPGTSWDFQLQIRGAVDKYVVFPIFGQ